MYCAALHSVLLYGFERWSLRAEDVRHLEVLCGTTRIRRSDRVRNVQIVNQVSGTGSENILSQWISLVDFVGLIMCCVC